MPEDTMSNERSQLGKRGESIVAHVLQRKGFHICEQNYKTRFGEIDIIACKLDMVIFVEVKMRTSHHFNLSHVVDYSKQRKIIKTALTYIWSSKIAGMIYRFDVALLELSSDKRYTMNYIANAFTAPETGDSYFFES